MRGNNFIIKIAALVFSMLVARNSNAQLKGDHLLGDFGLNAGSQPPPTVIGALPFYWYDAPRLKNSNGDVLTSDLDINAFLFGLGGSVVTNLKILDANYGATVLFAFMSNSLEGNRIESSTKLGFSDMYVQPLQLGWHGNQADFTLGYGVYMPTGKYEYGGDGNTGLGMWGHEFSMGTTVFLDQKKSFNISSIAFYETHSKKKDSEARVGDIISLSGGLGKTFYQPIPEFPIPVVINVGPIYYMQFKVGDDEIPLGSTLYTGSGDEIYAWGLEANVLQPKLRTSLSIRWLDEFSARNRFEGNTFLITAGYIIKSLSK